MRRTQLKAKKPWRAKIGAKVPLKRVKLPQEGVKKRKVHTELYRAKKELWELTRQLVFKTFGNDCYTCSAKNLIGVNCQGGHVPWPGSILSAKCKHDIRYLRAQCYLCNIHHGGMGAVALERMQREGINTEELWEINRKSIGQSYGLSWYKDQIAKTTALLAAPQSLEKL